MDTMTARRSPIPRTYEVPEMLRDLAWVLGHVASILPIWIGRRLSDDLREQIIVAVAQVNACNMCKHAHTRMALRAGVTDAELAALEAMDERVFDRRTWLAIAHARERTQAGFAPIASHEEHAEVVKLLGEQTVRDIEHVARVMTVANRIANTLNALSDRRRGYPIPGSRLGDELVISLLFFPGAWLGTLVAALRQRKSPFVVWKNARGI